MSSNKKAALIILSICLTTVVVIFALKKRIMGGLAEFLITQDPVKKCDAAFILGGEFPSRAIEAGDLYLKGFVKNIINVNQVESPAYDIIKSRKLPVMEPLELTSHLLRSMGVPSSSIFNIKEETDRTIQEARALKNFLLEKREIKCIAVVTSKFHLRRSKQIFKEVFKHRTHDFIFHPPSFDDYSPSDWWKKPRYVRNTVNEYLKLFAFEFGIY